MRRINLKLALVTAAVAAMCAGAAGVYATGASPDRPATRDVAATVTSTPLAHVAPSAADCAPISGKCSDVVNEPELTCEEARACATPTLRAGCPSVDSPCGPCDENPECACDATSSCASPPAPTPCIPPACSVPCPAVIPLAPGVALCSNPCVQCPVVCPAFAPDAAPSVEHDITCPLPSCPDITPAAGPDVAPAIAPYCGPLPCASTGGACSPPQPCGEPDGARDCPPPLRCLPVAPAPPEPAEDEPQASNPSCPEPLPPDCAISNDGAVSCPTPGANGGGAGSMPPNPAAGATPSIAE